MRGGLILGLAWLTLAGCARLPVALPPAPVSGHAALARAVHAAALPADERRAACLAARRGMREGADAAPQKRLDLAALALAVPGCLPAAEAEKLLRGLPEGTVTAYLRLIAARQAGDEAALRGARQRIDGLQAKLKALTLIEQQINQVKDHEFQNPGQSQAAPR